MSITDNIHSGVTDPSSPYFDPTLNAEWAEGATVRSYFGYGASDMSRRDSESYEEAWAVMSSWVVGDQPANVMAVPEVLGRIVAQMDAEDGIQPDPAHQRVGEAILRDSVLMPTGAKPDRAGLGSVVINLVPEQSPIANWNEDLSDPEFYPVVSFSVASEDGMLNHPFAAELLKVGSGSIAAFAQVYLPQSVRSVPARRVGGRIVPASHEGSLFPVPVNEPSGRTTWLPGAEMYGITRLYTEVEQAETDLANLRSAVKRLRAALRSTATEADATPEVLEPRRPRRA